MKNFFTLTELVVVVAVLALLGTLTASVQSRNVVRAKAVSCTANLQKIGKALAQYTQDNQNFICPNINTYFTGKKCYRADFWQDMISLNYMEGDWSAFTCTEVLTRRNTFPAIRPPRGTYPYTGSYARYRNATGVLVYGRKAANKLYKITACADPAKTASAADCASDLLEFIAPANVSSGGRYCTIALKRHSNAYNLLRLDGSVSAEKGSSSALWTISKKK